MRYVKGRNREETLPRGNGFFSLLSLIITNIIGPICKSYLTHMGFRNVNETTIRLLY